VLRINVTIPWRILLNDIELRLSERGIVLPTPGLPVGNYLPFRRSGSLIYISGQLPLLDNQVAFAGKIGRDLDLEQGQQSARLCGINILAQLRLALDGDLSRVTACVRLGGFVNCAEDFTEQAAVINGASDLLVEVFGDRGKHARAAVGCNALPRGAATEVEAVFECQKP
jgi:enamine deaminase RidA (YjgF/YER057c/UK114 family)